MIPFNRPASGPNIATRLLEVTKSGHHSGDGPMTRRAVEHLRQLLPEAAEILLTPSCTHALELAALTLDLRPGDEVIVPAFTFVSTANAFALRGATIRFADILPDTLCVDPDSVDGLINERTKAVVPVHYAGVACEMDRLGQSVARVGATLIEDNAHGLFGRVGSHALGSLSSMSTLSFHETKNVSCGEGGALVINDADLVDRAHVAREKGTNRRQFLLGRVDKYSWVDLGSSWLPSEFTAAVLVAALEHADFTQTARHRVWQRYEHELSEWAISAGVTLPTVPPGSDHPAHLFYLLMPTAASRARLISHLADRGVQAVFHYIPLDSSPFGRRYRDGTASCPVTADISERLIRLPLFADLSTAETDHIIESVLSFLP